MQDVPLLGTLNVTSAIDSLAAASALSGLGVCIALTFNFPGKATARDAVAFFIGQQQAQNNGLLDVKLI